MPPQFHSLTISNIQRFGDFAVSVHFDVPPALADAFHFLPGQYLTLKADLGGIETRRPYSICSAPEDDGISVGIKHVDGGVFSSHALTGLSIGDSMDVMTPQGRFIYDPAAVTSPDRYTDNHILLLAAGSGITPMLSIARAALSASDTTRVTLVYGNRNTASIMFRDLVEDLKDRYLDRLRLLHVLSREARDTELLNGRVDKAKITSLITAGLITPQDVTAAFLCGPDSMITDCRDALVAGGMGKDRIAFERFTPAPRAAGSTRPVKPAAKARSKAGVVDVDIRVDGVNRHYQMDPTLDTVLAAARTAGLELPFSCEAGMCCTCRCKLIEGDVEMDANFSLEQWEIDSGYILSCQARPTSKQIRVDFDAV